MECYGASHLLTIPPSESTARDLPSVSCLHVEIPKEDDLLLHLNVIINFIREGLNSGTGVMIHSFEDTHIRLALAAYCKPSLDLTCYCLTKLYHSKGMSSRRLDSTQAIGISLEVKGSYQ